MFFIQKCRYSSSLVELFVHAVYHPIANVQDGVFIFPVFPMEDQLPKNSKDNQITSIYFYLMVVDPVVTVLQDIYIL